ncbi:MAG: type I restriction endonuclease subunit R [Acidobacteria bacterium]|nr:type I restriction endonuclease subunit R [Acidobacteriota bacterium]
MSCEMSEDKLVQQTAADYLRDELGWESVYAFNDEVLGVDGTLGRVSEHEIVLTRYVRAALVKFNPGLPAEAYDAAVRTLTETSAAKTPLQTNREKYQQGKDGVPVKFRNEQGVTEERRLQVFDFKQPENNHFLVVRELWVQGSPYRRRPDLICFVNGLPLVFFELKNIHKDIRRAYNENLSDYKDTIPHAFDHNALIVLSNGDGAKLGSLSSKYEHFHEWKRLDEADLGAVAFETLLKGVCAKKNLLDIFENFIAFDETTGRLVKIVARNHQVLGVNRAVEAVSQREERHGQLGVFWHTQGSGKSYSMVFFAEKVHRKLPGSFTFLILTDRDDLDDQIYKTFAGCGVADHKKDECRAASGQHLQKLLATDKPYVFTMIQKFNKDVDPAQPYSDRNDLIVISDEAHRTQYGRLALNMRNALPRANYIGFTGTPLFKDDEVTKRIFGDYVSTYNFQRAVEDQATVPLFYDNRGEKLKVTTDKINEKLAAKLEEQDLDLDQQALLERDLARDYHVFTAESRLQRIAQDFVEHYTTRWETGKAMLVCLDKLTTVRMFNLIQPLWQEKIRQTASALKRAPDEQEEIALRRQLEWLQQTEIAVVVSEEQNEIKRFREWELDVVPHRTKIKHGYELADGKTLDLESAFKNDEHPFRVAIVCAMWLTGFDVPSLATLYLDKPLRAHTLMQAIARANRVYEGKNNGLIVDYCGILKNLRKALATFATGEADTDEIDEDDLPVKPKEELAEELAEAIALVSAFLQERGFCLDDLKEKTGFAKNAAIVAAKEAVNLNDETRKRFEIQAREVFKKFKACLGNIEAANLYKRDYDAIDIVYKKLQADRAQADITAIIKALHTAVDDIIATDAGQSVADHGKLYDISHIDFEKLKAEFAKSPAKNTTVQNLKDVVEKRLRQMIAKNPMRVDFQLRYQQVVDEYNREKDRVTIEQSFEDLLKFVETLDEEDTRALREGLEEEALPLFDLLIKPELSAKERNRLKQVAQALLAQLKAEKLRIDQWREKEATRSAVRVFIYDFLYDEKTGLPIDWYSETEVKQKAETIFQYVVHQYPSAISPAYLGHA